MAPNDGAANDDARFSDFTDPEILKGRIRNMLRQGVTFEQRVLEETDALNGGPPTKFRRNFNAFADDVAYTLRKKVIYRSDGGIRARGLVRTNGRLKMIHDAYLELDTEEGQEILLRTILIRRRDPNPPNRWVMSVDFRSVILQTDKEMETPEIVPVMTPCKRLSLMLAGAEMYLNKLPSDDAKFVQRMIDFAEAQGCPRNRGIWCYNGHYMMKYIKGSNAERAEMTRKTAGKLPFDGSTATADKLWRQYPFEDLLRKFPGTGEGREEYIARSLKNCQLLIRKFFNDLYHELERTAPARGYSLPFLGGSDYYGTAKPVFGHINDLRKPGSGHLYSCFPVTQ